MRVKCHEEHILQTVNLHQLVKADHIYQRHYAQGSKTHVYEVLDSMRERKLLFSPKRESVTFPHVYMLGRNGVAYLKEIGVDVPTIHPSEHKEPPNRTYLLHSFAVSDVIICAQRLSSCFPEITLATARHDLFLKRKGVKGSRPDAFLEFHITLQGRVDVYPLWVEVDRGTEDRDVFLPKMRRLMKFLMDGGFQEQYEAPSLTIVFATTTTQRRVEMMKDWIEKVLSEMRLEEKGELFMIGAIPEGVLDPAWLFRTPFWHIPFRHHHAALLEY